MRCAPGLLCDLDCQEPNRKQLPCDAAALLELCRNGWLISQAGSFQRYGWQSLAPRSMLKSIVAARWRRQGAAIHCCQSHDMEFAVFSVGSRNHTAHRHRLHVLAVGRSLRGRDAGLAQMHSRLPCFMLGCSCLSVMVQCGGITSVSCSWGAKVRVFWMPFEVLEQLFVESIISTVVPLCLFF